MAGTAKARLSRFVDDGQKIFGAQELGFDKKAETNYPKQNRQQTTDQTDHAFDHATSSGSKTSAFGQTQRAGKSRHRSDSSIIAGD